MKLFLKVFIVKRHLGPVEAFLILHLLLLLIHLNSHLLLLSQAQVAVLQVVP